MENNTMEQNETQTQEQSSAPAGLSLNDLAAVVRIIDICSKRGAFEGPELSSVGALREKFATFVEANKPAEEASTESQTETQSQ